MKPSLPACPPSSVIRPAGGGAHGIDQPRQSRPGKISAPASGLLALAVCLGLTGCFGFLKPARPTARDFVLSSLPATGPAAGTNLLALGVGPVKLPDYLFNTSLAVRQGINEIDYSSGVLWAEHLDTGLQRVLAANLSTLLPTDQIRLSAWRSQDVAAGIYVTIGQFDVDTAGQGVLVAWWRIVTPGGETTLAAGQSRLVLPGPAPGTDPPGAIATLSELAADFSRQLAERLRKVVPAAP